jgi:SAM-dependent methyltransferase
VTERARSFGEDADAYDRCRPGYPPALVDELAAGGGLDVVDVGCGTGKLGVRLAAAGCRVVGVEPDDRMAAVARSHGLDVEIADFVTWPAGDRRFDLVTSAQAWHWIDQRAGAAKAAAVLRPGGRLAVVWNRYRHEVDTLARLEAAYRSVAPDLLGDVVLGLVGGDGPLAGIDETGAFGPQRRQTFEWREPYTTEEWVAQLRTHSGQRALGPERLEELLIAIGDAVDAGGGSLTVHYSTLCISAVRR